MRQVAPGVLKLMSPPPSPAARLAELLLSARRGKRTLVMGILNVTPDSFADGGLHYGFDAAVAHAQQMAAEGADIIDVGGESTRPGAAPVPVEEEADRVVPVIQALAARIHVPISVDTYKSAVARAALDAGAVMVNDVTGLAGDPEMARTAAQRHAAVCVMHMRGTPRDMAARTDYADVVAEVRDWLSAQVRTALDAGVAAESIVVDPGFGFAKTADQNLELVRRLREIAQLGYPVLLGPSRKSTIGKILGGQPPQERVEGTGAIVALAIAHGAAMVRVHDVKEMVRVARVADAVVRGITF